MGGFADEDDAIAGKAVGGLHGEREYAAAGFDGHSPEQRVRASLGLGRKLGIVHRRKFGTSLRRDHADQTRAPAGKRHQREWALLGVEFSRRVVVRLGMGKIERERRLRISAAASRDPGSRTAHRARAIGADRELHSRLAAGMLDGDTRSITFDHQCRRCDRRHSKRSGARLQGREQVTVLDIVAESLAIDFGGAERDLGRAQQPPGVIDDAQLFQRCGVMRAGLPDTQSVERGHRIRQ